MAKKTAKTKRKTLNTTTLTRIRNLLSKDKFTYREIATRCKVSAPTVGRLAIKFKSESRAT